MRPLRIAVCVSGGGTTLQNLIDRIADGRLRAEIVQVIASRPRIGAIARAEAAGLPVAVVDAGGAGRARSSARPVFEPIRETRPSWSCSAGSCRCWISRTTTTPGS